MDITISQLARPTPRPAASSGFVRGLSFAMIGLALIVAALGIWLVSSAAADPAMLLVKMVLSLMMLITGALCLRAAGKPRK